MLSCAQHISVGFLTPLGQLLWKPDVLWGIKTLHVASMLVALLARRYTCSLLQSNSFLEKRTILYTVRFTQNYLFLLSMWVLTSVITNSTIPWDAMQCSTTDIKRRFGGKSVGTMNKSSKYNQQETSNCWWLLVWFILTIMKEAVCCSETPVNTDWNTLRHMVVLRRFNLSDQIDLLIWTKAIETVRTHFYFCYKTRR
jgi:hypothetical protein